MTDVWLPCGKTTVCVRVQTRNSLGLIDPVQKIGVAEPRIEIERAIKEPIGTRRLSESVKPESKIVIIVDNVVDKSYVELMILSVLDELNVVGVKDECVTVIVGCDLCGVVGSDDFMRFFGEAVLKRVRVVGHDVMAGDLVYVGATKSFGTRVFLNRVFVEADVRILLGFVNVHSYAGYSGGRQGVFGVCGVETVRSNGVMMLNGGAVAGVLDGNPVHKDMTEVARLAGVNFIVNLVVNSQGEIVRAFAGDLEAAFLEAVKLVDEMCRVVVDRRADIVVVSAGGYLVDGDLYQACSALDNVLDVVKRGGVIVLVADCVRGYGNQVFYDWMVRLGDLKSFEKELKRNFVMGGHRAYFLLKVLQNHQVILVSSLPDYYVSDVFRLKSARAVNDALAEAYKIAGSNSRVWVVSAGCYTLSTYKSPEEAKT